MQIKNENKRKKKALTREYKNSKQKLVSLVLTKGCCLDLGQAKRAEHQTSVYSAST